MVFLNIQHSINVEFIQKLFFFLINKKIAVEHEYTAKVIINLLVAYSNNKAPPRNENTQRKLASRTKRITKTT